MMPNPNNNQYPYREYEEPKSTPEIIIGNILKAVVCVFLIVIGFFLVIMVMSMLSTQTAVPFETYTQDFAISNPAMAQTVYTSNPLLSSVNVSKHYSGNDTWRYVDETYWTYDDSWASITINAGALGADITSLRVTALTDYAEAPVENVMTAWAIALIIGALCSVFGLVAWNKYNKR